MYLSLGLLGTTQKRCVKPLSPDLMERETHICPGCLSLAKGDLDSTQTYPLANSSIRVLCQRGKYLIRPLSVIEKPKDGVHALGAFLVTTRPYPGAHESHQQKLNSTYKKPASTRVPNSGSASRAIVGYHHGTPCHDYAGPSPMTSPSNPASVPEAPYEYLIHLPLSVRPRPAT